MEGGAVPFGAAGSLLSGGARDALMVTPPPSLQLSIECNCVHAVWKSRLPHLLLPRSFVDVPWEGVSGGAMHVLKPPGGRAELHVLEKLQRDEAGAEASQGQFHGGQEAASPQGCVFISPPHPQLQTHPLHH